MLSNRTSGSEQGPWSISLPLVYRRTTAGTRQYRTRFQAWVYCSSENKKGTPKFSCRTRRRRNKIKCMIRRSFIVLPCILADVSDTLCSSSIMLVVWFSYHTRRCKTHPRIRRCDDDDVFFTFILTENSERKCDSELDVSYLETDMDRCRYYHRYCWQNIRWFYKSDTVLESPISEIHRSSAFDKRKLWTSQFFQKAALTLRCVI